MSYTEETKGPTFFALSLLVLGTLAAFYCSLVAAVEVAYFMAVWSPGAILDAVSWVCRFLGLG